MHYNYSQYGNNIVSEFQINSKPANFKQADLFITSAKITPPKSLTTDHLITRLGFVLSTGKVNENNYYRWQKSNSYFSFIGNDNIYTIDTNISDTDIISIFVLNELFADFLLYKNLFLVHGSAIRHHGKALVFLGEPGAGKSTLAASFASQSHDLISDDLTAIFIKDNIPYVIPGAPYVKLWPDSVKALSIDNSLTPLYKNSKKNIWNPRVTHVNEPIPLGKLYELEFHNENSFVTKKRTGQQALQALIRHSPIPKQFLDMQERAITAMRILNQVDVIKFIRPNDINYCKGQIHEIEKHL